MCWLHLLSLPVFHMPEGYLLRQTRCSREISSEGQPNKQHLLRNNVMGLLVWTAGQAEERKWEHPFPFQLLHESSPGFITDETSLLCHLHSKQQWGWDPSQNLIWGAHSPNPWNPSFCWSYKWPNHAVGDDLSSGFTQMLWCRPRVWHPVRGLQNEDPWGLHLLFTPLLTFAFSSLNWEGVKFSWQVSISPYKTASDIYSHKVGGRLQRWTYESVFMGRRELGIGRNRASCISHIEQMRFAFPHGLWVLGKLSLTTKLNIQMSVLALRLILLNRVIHVNSLTGIREVTYLHAVSGTHICRIRLYRRTAASLPCVLLSHNLMSIKESEEKHMLTWQECCRMV